MCVGRHSRKSYSGFHQSMRNTKEEKGTQKKQKKSEEMKSPSGCRLLVCMYKQHLDNNNKKRKQIQHKKSNQILSIPLELIFIQTISIDCCLLFQTAEYTHLLYFINKSFCRTNVREKMLCPKSVPFFLMTLWNSALFDN